MNNPIFQKIRDYTLLISEGAFDLGVNLIVMILVQRALGISGLGIFSYLLSLMVFAGVLSELGITDYLEREVAIRSAETARTEVIENSTRAVFITSIVCMFLFAGFAAYGMAATKVDELTVAYIIIGITTLARNYNRLRMAILQGSGDYETAATLKTRKRIYLLVAVYILLQMNFRPSYLLLGYLLGEIGLLIQLFKKVRLPKIRRLLQGTAKIRSTLERSIGYFLTDEALDMIFYMDFLVLGFFVSSRDLGVYAQASILARTFLLIPTSIRPVFLGQYCNLASENRLSDAAGLLKKSAAFLFFLHAVLALYILLFFSDIQQSLFLAQDIDISSFYIFAQILPGLLFFSAVTSQEPLYEAGGQVKLLQQKIIMVAVINLGLNLFCVPFAGFFGAAFATAASMFAYFMFFGHHLDPVFRIYKQKYILAGTAVYLTYILFQAMEWGAGLTVFVLPVFLYILLTVMGFFDIEANRHMHPADAVPETIRSRRD